MSNSQRLQWAKDRIGNIPEQVAEQGRQAKKDIDDIVANATAEAAAALVHLNHLDLDAQAPEPIPEPEPLTPQPITEHELPGVVHFIDPTFLNGSNYYIGRWALHDLTDGDTVVFAAGQYPDGWRDIPISHDCKLMAAPDSVPFFGGSANSRFQVDKGIFKTTGGMRATPEYPNGKTLEIQGLFFRGTFASASDWNGAGIRHQYGNLWCHHSTFENCQNGILGGVVHDSGSGRAYGNPALFGRRVTLDHNRFIDCGNLPGEGDEGQAHDCYLDVAVVHCIKNTHTRSIVWPGVGHHIKVISDFTSIEDCSIGESRIKG